MTTRRLFLSGYLFLAVLPAFATMDTLFFRQAEDSLRTLSGRIVEPMDDAGRTANHQAFKDYFLQVLQEDRSFDYPFDSLQTISVLYAPDRSFRLITWYVPFVDQQFTFFGLIQRGQGGVLNQPLYLLEDRTADYPDGSLGEGDPENWYGSFYYELIHYRWGGDDYYTLLGWKANNPYTRKRVIEPLHMHRGDPVFGREMFDKSFGGVCRLVFEYAARASMSLIYEQRREVFFDNRKQPMIIFDRLEPLEERYQGQYAYYVPEVNILDGLYFDQGRWLLERDVDVRMPQKLPQ